MPSDADRAALLALLDHRSLPVPANPLPADHAGLQRVAAQPEGPLRTAMETLAGQGEYPWNAGFTPAVKWTPPAHDPGALGFRPSRGDTVHLNPEHELMRAFTANPQLAPLLASVLLHEHTHVGGASEADARQAQAGFLRRQTGPIREPAAAFADLLAPPQRAAR